MRGTLLIFFLVFVMFASNPQSGVLAQIQNQEFNIAQISWDKSQFLTMTNGILTVIEPDFAGTEVDSVEVSIWSSSDQSGIKVQAPIVNKLTGTFEAEIGFTLSQSSKNLLHVAPGDIITAKFHDETLPETFQTQSLEITSSAIISAGGLPLERVMVSNYQVINKQGQKLQNIHLDEQVLIQTDLSNQIPFDQDFVYLVQLRNDKNQVVSLSWIAGKLSPDQSFSPAQSWIPELEGIYRADIFVWESLQHPVPLSISPTIQFTVSV